MTQILAYQIINDVILNKPIEFIRDVKTQDDIEAFRKPLELEHGLHTKNLEITKHNQDPYCTHKKNIYQVLFTIKSTFAERFEP